MLALLGILCGLLAAAPMAWLLVAKSHEFARGLAAVGFAFALLQGALLLVRIHAPEGLLPFGVCAVMAFLGEVLVAVARAGGGA